MEDYTLEKLFCQDNELAIDVFGYYFYQRIETYTKSRDYWKQFLLEIDLKFGDSYEEYVKYRKDVTNYAIEAIKESPAYKHLNDNNNNFVPSANLLNIYPKNKLYTEDNIGKSFIVIRRNKRRLMSLIDYAKKHDVHLFDFGPTITPNDMLPCEGANSIANIYYTRFISRFTSMEHIITSKQIYKDIFDKCDSMDIKIYEENVMYRFLMSLINQNVINESDIYHVDADEIIVNIDKAYDITDKNRNETLKNKIRLTSVNHFFDIDAEIFTLGKFSNTDIYAKIHDANLDNIQLANVNPAEYILALRSLQEMKNTLDDDTLHMKYHEIYFDGDLVFNSNGKLARYIDPPKIDLIVK